MILHCENPCTYISTIALRFISLHPAPLKQVSVYTFLYLLWQLCTHADTFEQELEAFEFLTSEHTRRTFSLMPWDIMFKWPTPSNRYAP